MGVPAGTLRQVYDSLDFDALEAAGIANPRERAGLLTYLDELGFTVEEMVQAERRGRLFGLAGDVLLWSGPPIYTLATAADELGLSADDVARAWSLLGLTVAGPDVPTLSQADVDALATWVALKALVGEDGAFGLLRVLGTAMARLAEAESTMIRAGSPNIQMTHTHDELATARAYRAAAEFVPRIGALIDTVHRHHLASARTYFEGVIGDTSASVTCGIGFADLSSFTALTQALTPAQLQDLLTRIRRRRHRRGACRRWPVGEVHRRRRDVGELVARTTGAGGGGSHRSSGCARGRTAGPCRSCLWHGAGP